eukprot:CAMPEP_0172553884 /NCGR_PEP_ID=MMETSP1067-20121228/52227_1 /TAXON_ID=265564 ORGANISM="Thalassiosira punctigera, Strain Tpunct2005C2" /NCGR_SAMPLE_ID=MMETSP1067 /ASSEMBLY_ACC=CAM_ASM_000444 /LENGTH=559 /DNA_ID=CAMNT_0013342147 /DNA_START=109 /DNA_END=1788 /DNA_ORIENTATION=-
MATIHRMKSASFVSILIAAATPSQSFVDPAIKRRPSLRRQRSNNPQTVTPLPPSNSKSTDGNADTDGPFNFDGNNFYNDFEEGYVEQSISAAPDQSLFQSLQQRQEQIDQSSRALLERWTVGTSVRSFPAFTLNEPFYQARKEEQEHVVRYGTSLGWYGGNSQEDEPPFDWVRRIDIGAYPRVACGSAYGSVYVADVESRMVLGVARDVHTSHHKEGSVDTLDENLRRHLYGEYDGGGVLAVAMHGKSIVASAGREGGVKLFMLVGESELKYVGDVPSLKRPLPGVTPVLVTCLEFDSLGQLYIGGQDGFLRMVTFLQDFALTDDPGSNANEMQVTVISSPRQQMQRSPVLSLDISEDLEMVATAHANGNVCIHSIHQHGLSEKNNRNNCILVWNPFTSASCARSVKFVSGGEDEHNNPLWSIVVGGGNGELWMQEIHPSHILMTSDYDDVEYGAGKISSMPLFKEKLIQQIKPSHDGPVLSLAARPGGILVSAGQGGVLCVTRLWPTPQALYGLGGYKVWIGNVRIDSEGKRLLSDGRDDVVVVHDFSIEDKEEDRIE